MKCFYLTVFLVATVFAENLLDPLSDEFIEKINKQNLTWKAGRNFDKSMTMSKISRLLGVLPNNKKYKLTVRATENNDTEIPEHFDAREKWPNCTSIGLIRDQSNCGSCWAFAAVEAMSDRICIHSNGENQTLVSAEDLLSCCTVVCGYGCDGGYPAAAWEYWNTTGIVSGGLNRNQSQGCRSYSFEPCEHYTAGTVRNCSTLPDFSTPQCNKKCDNNSIDYNTSLTFGEKPYGLPAIERDIQLEILNNGPVEASFDVFDDFPIYTSGVYQRAANTTAIGGHAVKIIGWGVENGTKFWLIANSWNEDWGDKGYVKFLRGVNHCGIEDSIVAALPKSLGGTLFPTFGKFVLAGLVSSVYFLLRL